MKEDDVTGCVLADKHGLCLAGTDKLEKQSYINVTQIVLFFILY